MYLYSNGILSDILAKNFVLIWGLKAEKTVVTRYK